MYLDMTQPVLVMFISLALFVLFSAYLYSYSVMFCLNTFR